MTDIKKKLESLLKQNGLKTGAEWEREQTEHPKERPHHQTAPPQSSGGANPSIPSETPSSLDLEGLTRRLERFHGTSGGRTYTRVEQEPIETADYEIQRVVPGRIIGKEYNGFYLVRHDYPLDHRQGVLPLRSILESSSKHIAFSANDGALVDFDPRTACFVDTETIGLAGGAGTVAFLIGNGYFTEDGFRLDQCFMRDYDDEEPMLRFLAERFGACNTVVSYNGKSFDFPLLRTRFIQNRIPFRLEGAKHLDLVHAARRFWKRRLHDCSLGNIEREVLGVYREGDIPSYLIPQLWFDYLRNRDARPLAAVFYHHYMDILSLVALTAWLSQCLDAPDGEGFTHAEDRLSVVRLHFRQKQYADVTRHAHAFLNMHKDTVLRRECLEMLGLALKRMQRWKEMQDIWEKMVEEFPDDITARLELAKHHEHRSRNLARAAQLCEEALALYREPTYPQAVPKRSAARTFAHRLERIRKKMARTHENS